MNVFERYAPFIQDYIYRSGWQALRGVQNAAGEAIFGTGENVLLTASTASGAQRVWVMNTRCLLISSRPWSRSWVYCSITLSMGPRYFLPGVILPSFTSMQGFSFSRLPPKALRAEHRPPLYR